MPGYVNNDCIAQNMQALTFSGFEEWGGAGAYFDDTTLGEFDVLRPGSGYINGIRITWTAPQTTTGMTAGNTYFIYIDDTGTIGKSDTWSSSLFEDNIVLFECMRDSTAAGNNQVTVREDHPYNFPTHVSVEMHEVIGAVLSGQGGANITLNGTKEIEISGADTLHDHGLDTTIPDSGGAPVTFNFYFTLGSGKWARAHQQTAFASEYNNAGVVTALGANKFGVYRLYVSKDNLNSSTPVYFAILGDAQYNNITAAQTAISNGLIPDQSNELFEIELGQLGYVIKAQSTDTIVDVIIEKTVLRGNVLSAASNNASLITTDTTNFDGWLSAADTTVQSALETLDAIGEDNSLFFAYSNTIQTNVTGDGTEVTIAFDTELYDLNGDYNNGTYTFTAPITGYYLFTCSVYLTGLAASHVSGFLRTTTSNRAYLLRKGNIGILRNPGDNTTQLDYTLTVDMDAADTATFSSSVGGNPKTVDIAASFTAADQRTFLSGKRLI